MLMTMLASSDPSLVDDVADSASETAESVADSAVDQLQSFGDLFSFLNINNLLSIGVRVLVIVLVLGIAYRVVRTLINRAFKARMMVGRLSDDSMRQLETTRRMVLSVIFYATILLGAMAILSIFGFDMRALAASAGIAGAALVFISQNVILDWINGVFILVERQFSVGDYVRIGEYSGEVQSITIRHTVIKTDFNETVSIPNGDINIVVNYSQDPVTEFFDVRIHDATRLDEGKELLNRVCAVVNSRHEEQPGWNRCMCSVCRRSSAPAPFCGWRSKSSKISHLSHPAQSARGKHPYPERRRAAAAAPLSATERSEHYANEAWCRRCRRIKKIRIPAAAKPSRSPASAWISASAAMAAATKPGSRALSWKNPFAASSNRRKTTMTINAINNKSALFLRALFEKGQRSS